MAAVSGACDTCHTMHDSQGGLTMKMDSTPVIGALSSECYDCHAQLRPELVMMDCLGCHAQAVGGAVNIIAINNIPQVLHNTTILAAGNFRNVFIDDSYGHNVHGFGSNIESDTDLGNTPPGYNSDFDPSTGKYQPAYNLNIMCAGRNGCHGDRDELSQALAMKGSHHYKDSMLKFGADFTESTQGTTVGNSYRFLYGVHGAEDADWEASSGAADHNEYRGANLPAAPASFQDVDTIGEFCAECHGDFHSAAGTGGVSPWIRHPNNFVIPDELPYTDYTVYNPTVPVARPAIADDRIQANTGVVTAGADLVTCLSCHRAHGSPYADILRWDYITDCETGGLQADCGCLTCHADKD